MKKLFLLLFLGCFYFFTHAQIGGVIINYNKKLYKVTNESVVKDTTEKVYTYGEWTKLFYSGEYSLGPINPNDNKTAFLIIKMTEQERMSYFSDSRKPEETPFFKTGTRLNFFKGKDINDSLINTENLVGKILVINFWFINCPPCRAEIPLLNKLVSFYADDTSIVFISIALEPKNDLKDFLKKIPFDYRIIYNGKKLAWKYNVEAYPTNLIVNREGIIAYHSSMSGPIPDYWMRRTIEEIKGRN